MTFAQLQRFTRIVHDFAPDRFDNLAFEADHDIVWFSVNNQDVPLTDEVANELGLHYDESFDCWASFC